MFLAEGNGELKPPDNTFAEALLVFGDFHLDPVEFLNSIIYIFPEELSSKLPQYQTRLCIESLADALNEFREVAHNFLLPFQTL